MKILMTSNIDSVYGFPLASEQDIVQGPFKLDTGTEYYNRFIDPDQIEYMRRTRNRTGDIILMSPIEYFDICSTDIFEGQTVDSLKRQREYSKSKDGSLFVNTYRDAMLSGDKFPMPFINIADPSQEGLHRMYAAGEAFGWDIPLPVLIVTVYDRKKEDEWKFQESLWDFNRNKFRYYCQAALDELSDWYGPVPEQFPQLLQNLILQQAADDDLSIEIDVDIKEIEDHGEILHRVLIYLTKYMGYEIPNLAEPYEDWLENLFDVNNSRSKQLADSDSAIDQDLYNLLFM